jgi:ABC-type transport system involved in multi-copper enzyme maturation permease subunit
MKLFEREEPVPVEGTVESIEDRPKGTWEDSGYRMSDEEAHRDTVYHIPNQFMQTVSVFKTQMGLYSKRKAIYLILIIAILIPIIYIMAKDIFDFSILSEASGTGLIGVLLSMLPFIIGIFTASLCGSVMPTEFTERSAYMNMALPMSRTAFCLGKYLAGVVITIGVFVFAYGMAMAGSLITYSFFDEEALARSFIMMLLSVLVYTSFTFTMGCLLKRGSTIVSFLLIAIVLPVIEMYLFLNNYVDTSAFLLCPNLLPDLACFTLGSNITMSPLGILNAIVHFVDASTVDLALSCVISIVWCVAFLALGIFAIERREM